MFRVTAQLDDEPRRAVETKMVFLSFDREGLTAFASCISEYSENFVEPERLGHAHFRDRLDPRVHHPQHRDWKSKAIVIFPTRPQPKIADRDDENTG